MWSLKFNAHQFALLLQLAMEQVIQLYDDACVNDMDAVSIHTNVAQQLTNGLKRIFGGEDTCLDGMLTPPVDAVSAKFLAATYNGLKVSVCKTFSVFETCVQSGAGVLSCLARSWTVWSQQLFDAYILVLEQTVTALLEELTSSSPHVHSFRCLRGVQFGSDFIHSSIHSLCRENSSVADYYFHRIESSISTTDGCSSHGQADEALLRTTLNAGGLESYKKHVCSFIHSLAECSLEKWDLCLMTLFGN